MKENLPKVPESIIGVDEVGRGCLAGPLLVCAFLAPDESWTIPGLNDSKKLSEKKRVEVCRELMSKNMGKYTLVWVSEKTIDQIGIDAANNKGMREAAEELIDLTGIPNRVIFDGVNCPLQGGECYAQADGKYPAVMAASIIAKVTRDLFMVSAHEKYPHYDFLGNKGYGTEVHRKAIVEKGVCYLHRMSFEPAKSLYGS